MTGWAFTVLGDPAPQGSKKHVGHGVMVESSKKVQPWRESVKAAVEDQTFPMLGEDGPVLGMCVFTLRRPASARKKDLMPFRTPDVDKLLRSTLDAVKQAGLVADDARFSELVRLAKVWPGMDPHALHVPGVVFAAVDYGPGCRTELRELFDQALAIRLRKASA